jgi:hypothetical protein
VDPITLVVTAVALGASVGLTDTATTAVKDAYAALKTLLARRQVDVSGVERRPTSTTQRDALRENLADPADVVDDEMLAAAQQVTEAVAANEPDAGAALGLDVSRVKAEFLRARRIRSEGTGVRVQDATFTGGIDIDGVVSGPASGTTSPTVSDSEDGDPSGR